MQAKSRLKLFVFLISFVALATTSQAATSSIPFTGLVLSICSLIVGTPGVIAPNANYNELSSSNSGGIDGTITAITTGTGFSVTTEAPSGFTLAPTGGSSNVAFSTSYSATGATTINLTAGTTITPINLGATVVDVELTATKSIGSFPAGAYAAEVLVRCE